MEYAEMGRDVSQLDAAREALAQQQTALIVVSGVLGSGRTTTLRSLAEECVHGTSHPVLYGGGLSSLTHIPAMSLSRALRAPLPVEDEKLIIEAALARVRAGVLVIDDLQWADATTLSLITQLSQRMRVVVSVQTPSGLDEKYLATLRQTADVWHTLTPLTHADAVALIKRLAPTCTQQQSEKLAAWGGRNPLTLHTLALAAARGEMPDVESLQDSASHSVLVHAVTQMLATLERPARTALAVLGVLSRPAEMQLLGDGAQQLVDAHLVEQHSRDLLAPVSPYFAQIAASALSEEERSAVHRHIASLPSHSSVTPLEAARHAHAAGQSARARMLAQRAYDAAERTHNYGEMFAAAVVLAALPDAATADHIRAAAAAMRVGKPQTALRCAERITGRSVEAEFLRAEAYIHLGDDRRGGEIIAQLWEGHTELHAKLFTLSALAAVLAPRSRSARAVKELEQRAGQLHGGVPFERAVLAALQHRPLWHVTLEEALSALPREDTSHWWGAWLLATRVLEEGKIDAAEAYAHTYRQHARDAGIYGWGTRFTALHLWCRALRSQALDAVITEAIDLLDHALSPHAEAYALAAASLALADTGSLSHARTRLEKSSAPLLDTPMLRWVDSEISWLDHTPDRVQSLPQESVQSFSLTAAMHHITSHWAHEESWIYGGKGLALSKLDHVPTLDAAKLTLDAWSDLHSESSVHTLQRAAELWHRVCVREEVRSLLAAAISASHRRDATTVTELLIHAGRVAEEHGLKLLRARVHRVLRHSGHGRVHNSVTVQKKVLTTEGVELTQREQQVLELVAAGEPTRRIATLLGVSRMTVETHVRSGMRRLGARTRTEAAAVLMRSHLDQQPDSVQVS